MRKQLFQQVGTMFADRQFWMCLGLLLAGWVPGHARNPIVPDRGLNDPHIHIFGDRAYVFASHDRSATNKTFIMDDWWVWSSPDLVHWTNECVIKPEQTYIARPFTGCWATDAAYRNGKYYFYFSEGNQQAGVLVGDSPSGPWRDPLGGPLLTSDLTPTHEYDMCVFQDDDGSPYIVFGVWDYYIARLNEDMVSLAGKPRLLELDRKCGPYGEGKTDDISSTSIKATTIFPGGAVMRCPPTSTGPIASSARCSVSGISSRDTKSPPGPGACTRVGMAAFLSGTTNGILPTVT
jgi:hypothetical protein